MNAYVERFIQTIQHECLDKFIVFSQEHLDLLTNESMTHYHEERRLSGMLRHIIARRHDCFAASGHSLPLL
jgi:hypothetical protein